MSKNKTSNNQRDYDEWGTIYMRKETIKRLKIMKTKKDMKTVDDLIQEMAKQYEKSKS